MAHYYIKHFLPLCVDLCRPGAGAAVDTTAETTASTPAPGGGSPTAPGNGADGSGSGSNGRVGSSASPSRDGGAAGGGGGGGETDAAEGLSFFPDPTRDVSEHSPVARGVAYIFLKRQQVRRWGQLL